MSEPAPEAPVEPAEEPQEGKTFDADYVEKLRKEAAKYRTEAKTNAEAAKRLAQIEESQKTEAQKLAEKIAAAEKDASDARREALKFKVAAKFQINDEDADLFLTGSDEETLTKQAERLGQRTADQKKRNNYSPSEGNNPNPAGDKSDGAFARALFGGE